MPDDDVSVIGLRLPAWGTPDQPEEGVALRGKLKIKDGEATVGIELPFRLTGGPTAPGGQLTIFPGDFDVSENATNGTPVGTMQAAPGGGTFAITAGNAGGTFAIGASSGVITVADAGDLVAFDEHNLTVSYTLGEGSVSGGARIAVAPGNPVGDSIFAIDQKVGFLGGTQNGDVVGRFAVASELTGLITFAIQSGNTGGAFELEGGDGDTLLVADVDELASPGTFNLVVRATFTGGQQDFNVVVNVTAVWQPTDEATLACWGLFESTADLVMSGSSVTQGTDKSGDGNHFTPKSGTPAPLFESNVWNGRGMISDPLGGASGCRFGALTVQNIGPGHPHTGAMVIQVPTDLSVNQQALSYNDGVVPGNGFVIVAPDNKIGLYASTTLLFIPVATFPRNCILVWEDDGAGKVNLWLDGAQVLVDAATTSPESTTARLNVTLSIFGQYNGGVGFQGKVGEIVSMPGAVNRTRTLNLVGYLNRWKTPLGQAPANEPPIIAPQSFQHFTGQPNGTNVYQVSANDPEGEALTFSISTGNTDGAYAIDSLGRISIANTGIITAGSRVLSIRVIDVGGLATDAPVTITVTNPAVITDGVFADPVNGLDTNNGLTEATAVKSFSALQTKVRANPGKKGYMRQGRFFMTAAVTFDGNDAGDTYRNYPGEEPTISGGALATGRETIGAVSDDLSWWSAPGAVGVRPFHLELKYPGQDPIALRPTLFRPAGYAASNYAASYPTTKEWREGWILVNAGSVVNQYQGTIAEAAISSHLAGLGMPSDGQVYGIVDAAPSTKPLEYFWYTRGLQSVSGTQLLFKTGDQISGPDMSDAGIHARRIHSRCRFRLFGYEAWVVHAEERNSYAYAPNCGTLTFDGLVAGQSFSPGTKINGQNSGATGVVLAVTVSGTTGTLWLSRVTGTWSNNEPIRLGSTVKATVDGTLTSKGNRIVVRAEDTTGAELVYPTRARLVSVTSAATDMVFEGLRFANGTAYVPIFKNSNANEKGQMIDVRAHRTTFRKCEFGIAGFGILMDAVNDCLIDDCGFQGIDGPSILLRGGTRSEVVHCYFGEEARGPSQSGDGCATVHVTGNASFLKIRYNYFDELDDGAIVGYGWGPGNIIELNTFFRVNRTHGDSQGAIYVSSPQANTANPPAASNRNTFRRNYCHGGGGVHTGNSTTTMTWKGSDVKQCYLDDGGSYWDVYENVFVCVGDDLASTPIWIAHSWPDKPVDSNKVRHNFVLATDKSDAALDGNIEYAPIVLQNQGGAITNMEIWGNICINAPQATRFGGYYAVASGSGAGWTLRGWNVLKNHHGAGSSLLGATGDRHDPPWQIVVSESVADVPYSCNPTLASGTAQQLKQARGVGIGIGWPTNDLPWAEMQKAGRRAA